MALPIALQIEEGLLQSKGLKRNAKKSSRSWTPDDAAAAGWTEGEAEGDDAEAWPPEAVDGHAEGTPEHWAAETGAGEAEVTAPHWPEAEAGGAEDIGSIYIASDRSLDWADDSSVDALFSTDAAPHAAAESGEKDDAEEEAEEAEDKESKVDRESEEEDAEEAQDKESEVDLESEEEDEEEDDE